LISLLPWPLFATGAFAIWVALLTQRRGSAPGARMLVWLMAMVAWWSMAGGAHALAATVDAKIVWAKVQYLAIAAVPPLWFLFATEYAQTAWAARRNARIALWIVAALTVVAAATNESHHAVWASVHIESTGATVYQHGWLFWVVAASSYLLVVGGAVLLIRALRQSPPPFRLQGLALITAAVVPLAANVLYLTGVTIPGLDPTPLAFAVSGLLFTHALYRNRLLDLIPVARDVVVETLSDAVIVLDSARRILDMNAAARKMAGEPHAWAGQPVAVQLPLLRQLRLDVVTDSSTTLTLEKSGAGEAEYYDVRVIRVRGRHESAAAWVVVLRDVTEQLRAEAERAALEARVQEQQKRESLSVLAGGLAHDFNNLLTGIVGNADLLSLQIPPSSELGNSVGAILLGAQRAADLVDKMLAYAGERHGSIATVDLDELVRDMVDLLRASAARHCALHFEGARATVEADPTQVRQVVMNLIINAADAVEETSGAIHVAVGAESLSAEQLREIDSAGDAVPGRFAYLDVQDNGAGMDAATIGRIFEPFFTTKPTGHGLGLAAVQGIVHGHRGALRVESRPGSGTRFRVWFPLAAMDQTPTRRTSKSARPSVPVFISKS
jgi:signal transduction histidine kinase